MTKGLHGLDANWVAGTLWQGAYPAYTPSLKANVHAVVFAAVELQPMKQAFYGIRKIRAPIDDADRAMTEREWQIVKRAASVVRHLVDRDFTVLVTCHAGLNRSGLITAMTLMLPPSKGAISVRTPSCMRSTEAIRVVRAARSQFALGNPYFVQALGMLDGVLSPHCRTFLRPTV